ncbi:MAG: TonB-dependent receptor [Bacteroidales bacterium]|nr:TonB-dependent receptor [Bacteroidales bacterium]
MRKLLFCTFATLAALIIEVGLVTPDALAQSERAASQQRIVVAGVVVDQSGEPVIGATVLDKDSSNGVMTDADGHFSLEVKPGANVLVTCIGYKDYAFRAAPGRSLKIVLEDDLMLIEETVVTAFATQKRVNVTGAITMVTGDDVVQAPVANVSSALVGITPGLSAVTVSGEPGQDAADIAIRGISSYSGNTSPLIVIDGIEQPTSQAMSILNGLNANDILGISVLKDASSTAVYGIRAANGVIIITTRRGQKGAPRVSFSGNFGLTSATNVQRGLSSYEYALFRNEAIYNEVEGYGSTPLMNYLFTEDDLWKFKNNRDFTPAEVAAMPNLTEAQRQQLLNSEALYYGTSDAYAELYSRVAPQWSANVSVSGGAERMRYYVSLNYFDQQSIMQNANYFGVRTGSRYQRYNVRANIDVDIFDHTTLSVNTSGQFGSTKGPGTGSLYSRYSGIMQIIYEGNPFTNRSMVLDDKLIVDFDYPQNSVQDGLHKRTDNEMTGGWLPALLSRSVGTSTNTRVDVSMRLRHDLSYLVKGLDIQASLRYQENYSKVAVQSFAIPSYTVRRSLTNPNELEFFGGTVGADSYASGSWGGMRDFYADVVVNYQGNFGKHNVGGLLLGRATKYTMPGDSFNTPSGLIGTSARLTYDYDTRYMVELNFAYNGTENFAKGHRFGFFPAASVGYVFTNEPFFPKNNFLTFLKLRASYGLVGNDQIGGKRYLYLPGTYSIDMGPGSFTSTTSSGSLQSNYYQFGTSTDAYNTIYLGSAEGALGNPDVTWEKSEKISAGLEIRFFKDRLYFTGDYFSEKRRDILTTLGVIPVTFGVPSWNTAAVNVGKVKNHGYELVLGWKDRVGDFSYYLEGNLTYAKNTIVYMAEAPNPYDWMNQTGHSIGQYYGYKTDGFYDTLEELSNRPYFSQSAGAVTLGDIKYVDLNGDGVIDNKDQGPIGYPNRPLMNFGGKIGFSYKGFDIKMVLSGTAMGTYYISRITSPFFKRAGNAFLWQYEGRWTPEKVAAGTPITYPRAVYDASQDHYDFGPKSDLWALASDHLRIKNVEIGYTFNKDLPLLKRARISSLRIYANANNLFTFFDQMSRYGIDPETKDNLGGSEGNISYVFPLTRTVNFGVNINF